MTPCCPICLTPTLEPSRLEAELPTERCSACLGHWISSQRYFGYVATDFAELPVEHVHPHADPSHMKRCPTCARFMHYYPVGHGLPFGIDKCNTCGGVWLNDGEWEAFKSMQLHRRLHAISSDAWQERVMRERRLASERAAMERRLGTENLEAVERFLMWLKPHRAPG